MPNHELADRAVRVLKANDLGRWTRPAPGLYPHQWLWDSCFVAIGLTHIDPERAATELVSLTRGQWASGMFPHMIYSTRWPARLESWLWGKLPDMSGPLRTSPITQPPLLAVATERVARRLTPHQRAQFLAHMVPAIIAYHQWLYRERDPRGTGLAVCLHSWESGMDDSPYWTDTMNTMKSIPLRAHLIREYRLVHRSQRASVATLQHMAALMLLLRECRYDSGLAIRRSPVVIEDLVFNSILIAANESLTNLADAANIDLPDELAHRQLATRTAVESLWDESSGQYYSRDYHTGRLIKQPTAATFAPLFAGSVSPSRATHLRGLLSDDPGWNVAFPVPSVPVTSPRFEEHRYWRGPTWLSINWLVATGLARYGFSGESAHIRKRSNAVVLQSGFREYFSPLTGHGLGAHNFSWTAALTLDMIYTRHRAGEGAELAGRVPSR